MYLHGISSLEKEKKKNEKLNKWRILGPAVQICVLDVWAG